MFDKETFDKVSEILDILQGVQGVQLDPLLDPDGMDEIYATKVSKPQEQGRLSGALLLEALQKTAELMNGSTAYLFSTDGEPIGSLRVPDEFFYADPCLMKIVPSAQLVFENSYGNYYTNGQIKFFKEVNNIRRLIFELDNTTDELLLKHGDTVSTEVGTVFFT